MPKVKTTPPEPSREKGQRSIDLPLFLDRHIFPWMQPEWLEADAWRRAVQGQPFAIICRETLLSYIIALDWKIEPRDSTKRDEYKKDIDYYTKFIEYTGDYDFVEIIEWMGKDILDLPFGAAAELGKEGDSPNGKLLWIELLDGGTLFPTLNSDFPVGQRLKELPTYQVYFPAHAINRIYYSPRPEIKRKGWGMPPPEKIYLALQLLNRGDVYYANLLIDTPQVGILDLADMEKTAAEEWVKSWRTLLTGIDPFKIPVLYEHTQPATFIPFTKNPTELMFDKAILKYAAIVASGYGMSLSDVGIQAASSGGETLAGSIRQERRTRKSGFARLKKKFTTFFNKMLPEYLEFKFIDLDDEQSVARGRARLSDATAWSQYIDKGIFTPEEARQQTIVDGLISISIPEKIPKEAMPLAGNESPERPSMLGRPVAPSAGGQGEVRNSDIQSDSFSDELDRISKSEDVRLRRLIRAVIVPLEIEINNVVEILEDDQFETWNEWHDEVLFGKLVEEVPELTKNSISLAMDNLRKLMDTDVWWRLNLDGKQLSQSLNDVFSSLYKSKVQKSLELAFEKGEINTFQSEGTVPNRLVRKYIARTSKSLDEYIEQYPDLLRKAIISGARKFLTMNKSASRLDIEEIMVDNNLVDMVRTEICRLNTAFLVGFADLYLDIVNNILENYNDDKRTT